MDIDWKVRGARFATNATPTACLVRGALASEEPLNSNPDTASHGAPKHAMANPEQDNQEASETEPATSRYVEQLERRIEEKDDVIGLLRGQLTAKDEQIGELSMRYRETHALLGAMQRMLAPLLGQADPYERDKRKDQSSSASA
jgi:hypothetical protein